MFGANKGWRAFRDLEESDSLARESIYGDRKGDPDRRSVLEIDANANEGDRRLAR